MGTSKSHGGPTDTSLLLPDWARNPEGSESVPDSGGEVETPSTTGADQPPQTAADDEESEYDDSSTPPDGTPTPSEQPWRTAKVRLSRAVQSGGDRRALRSAGEAYVRARGGARGAAGAARAGRKATASLAGFLTGIATGGVRQALERTGLSEFVGRDAGEVFAAITNALSPDGASTEEAAARHATSAVLEELYERFAVDTDGLERLDAMTAADVRTALESSIASYIYFRWLGELGQRIENRSISAAQAERLEREMKRYVRDIVQLDLSGVDLLQLDWNAPDGAKLVAELYAQAYAVLGASL